VTMDYIRQRYGVPAKRGARIRFADPNFSYGRCPQEGTIVAAPHGYIHVRFDGSRSIVWLHPTWCVEYLDD
jgi:hypothetical protein